MENSRMNSVQWLGDMRLIIEFVGHDLPTYGENKSGSLRIITSKGDKEVKLGDWICWDVEGNLEIRSFCENNLSE